MKVKAHREFFVTMVAERGLPAVRAAARHQRLRPLSAGDHLVDFGLSGWISGGRG
jgi:hypothetical protein